MQEFAGTDRIAVLQRLGSGGFGIVYRGFDRDRNIPVAIKTLRNFEPSALSRFKDEYRSLADIAHPNLITLYELMSEGDQWFFTMELVDGVDFLAHVYQDSQWEQDRSADPSADTLVTPSGADDVTGTVAPYPSIPPARHRLRPATLDRLRVALRQLTEGVDALHQAGKLHRDIKPSNVMVTEGRRVVLLDFGLASDAPAEDDRTVQLETQLFGTPAYMAPELMQGQPAAPASDWYAVGVMLYEALTGQKPFAGPVVEQAVLKQQADAPRPSSVARDVPDDLDALCVALLQRDPLARPSGAEVLARLGSVPTGVPAPPPRRSSTFVGRTSEIAELDAAYRAVAEEGRAVVLAVSGGPGVGKTALIRQFLGRVADREPRTVILAGRCYESESVPYKAVDSVLDALARHLIRLPADQAAAVLPREVDAVTRLFPVLGSVPAIASAPRKAVPIRDSVELRRRAFLALRELFQRLADRAPMVLVIDDLHWGDVDSAALIAELLRPPDSPALLLLSTFRASERNTAPMLVELFRQFGQMPALEVRDIVLADLGADEARGLAMRLLAAHGRPVSEGEARRVADDAAGNPLFIGELARYQQQGAEVTNASAGAGLEQVIRARVAALPEDARLVLELTVVAGQPIDLAVVTAAASLEAINERVLALLRSSRLIRGSGTGARRYVEPYHDRIREVLTAGLPPELARTYHLRIGDALEDLPDPDPERLAFHFLRAGAMDRAIPRVIEAADLAAAALAFDRAAGLYRQALDLRPPETAALRRHLLERLGSALANAGNGMRAAEAFLAASREATGDESIDLTRRAAQHFLMSGHIEPGMEALQAVLRAAGLRFPSSPRRALISMLLTRLRLDLRRYRFTERPADRLAARDLRRIDACWAVAAGLGNIDVARAAAFGARHALFALQAGEPYRVARALSAEVGQRAVGGQPMRQKCLTLAASAQTLVDRLDDPRLTGLHHVMSGVSEFLMGRWMPCFDRLQAGETILREQCAGVAWELATCHLYLTRTLYWLGEIGELSRRLPRLIEEAAERGDLFATATLRARAAYLTSLAASDPARAREDCRRAMEHWTRSTFHVEHYFELVGLTEIDLYEGNGAAAWDRVSSAWRVLTHSLLMRVQVVRTQLTHLRGRTAVLAARQTSDRSLRDRLLATADRDVRAIEREGTAYAAALALLLRGSISVTRGDHARAIDEFRRAEDQCLAQDMRLHMAAARRARGLLLSGDEGRAVVGSAGAWMSAQLIGDPDRFSQMLGT